MASKAIPCQYHRRGWKISTALGAINIDKKEGTCDLVDDEGELRVGGVAILDDPESEESLPEAYVTFDKPVKARTRSAKKADPDPEPESAQEDEADSESDDEDEADDDANDGPIPGPALSYGD